MSKLIYLFLTINLFLIACNEADDANTTSIRAVTIKNLPADPPTGYDPATGRPIGETGKFTFFRLSDSSIVSNADSATNKWDIAFRSSTIIVNSGTSGPGNGGAYVFNGAFTDVLQVHSDSIFYVDAAPNQFAIGKTWYNYDGAAMVFAPKPGKTIVIRSAEGKYAKLEILSYYKDAPISPNAFSDQARFYTFRYVYQADGTKKFE
ncbi:MAG: HmuY family protein [Bacteroidota bacterium]|nr:HmuY family protein [Bacteroidota bacterium]